jgi:hypothetical protein
VIPPVAGQNPGAGIDAVQTLAANALMGWTIPGIAWSYNSLTPVAGQLIISWTDPVAGAVTEVYFIMVGGPGVIGFPTPKRFPRNQAVTITLKSGGGGVSGTVYAVSPILES